MLNSTVGKNDKELIVRESLNPMSCQSQWEGETTDSKSVFIEIYCGSLRIGFSEVGENVFIARENSKSNEFDHEIVLLPENNTRLSLNQLMKILDNASLLTESKETDEDDTTVD